MYRQAPVLLLLLFVSYGVIANAQSDPVKVIKERVKDNQKGQNKGVVDYPAIKEAIDEDYNYLEGLYLHYHTSPELSFYEVNTAKRMAEELRQLNFKVTEKVGGHGVVGIYENGKGPTLMIRADMDALPITEETGVAYASKVTTTDEQGNTVGVMHACGHDVHMTVWAGTARRLIDMRDQWSGTLMFIGQPAEERAGGAKAMLKDGLFERFPVPDYAIALHVKSDLAAGKVGYCPGYTMANVDMMDITVFGEGGHGAYPHTTKDPVVLASRIVIALQTIVSREISPLEPAVVTVGAIQGGTKGNVIPNEVTMQLTMRSYTDEVRHAIIEKIERICRGVAISAGLEESQYPKIKLRDEFTPSTYNQPELTERLATVFVQALDEQNVVASTPVMGGEDFSMYGRTDDQVPISMFWLGAVNPIMIEKAEMDKISLPSLHNSRFLPAIQPTIKTGVLAMTAAALDLLDTH
jgi:amidohydrolase